MTKLHIPGQVPDTSNPLLVLATAIEKQTMSLERVLHSFSKSLDDAAERKHHYALAQVSNDNWGTYCYACSDEAMDFIYPCVKFTSADRPAPPSTIAVLPDPS